MSESLIVIRPARSRYTETVPRDMCGSARFAINVVSSLLLLSNASIPLLCRSPITNTASRQTMTSLKTGYVRSRFRAFSITSPRSSRKQKSIPASYYRGGTSRAIMFLSSDLPSAREQWPDIFRAALGSPDPHGRQLDGMGGGISSLSKICVVGPPTHPRADVDYTFAAVGVRDNEVDFSSNCGNMTSAVGPFAIDSGLVKCPRGRSEVTVRIHNTNTHKLIHATFPVDDSEAVAEGDFAIDGVADTSAKISLSFIEPAGSKTGKLLPTGRVVDRFDKVSATCIDVGNPCVFVSAEHLDIDGTMLPDAMDTHPTLLTRLDSVRRQAGVAMGLCDAPSRCPGSIPKIAVVSSPAPHKLLSGDMLGEDSADVVARAVSVGQPHRAVPITVAMALAAASKLDGSVVQMCCANKPVDADGVTIGHASGRILVSAEYDDKGGIKSATLFRTARRLFEGRVFVKNVGA